MTWPCVAGFQYLLLAAFGVPRVAWRYINMRDALQVAVALTLSTSVLVVLRLAHLLPTANNVIPLSVLVMDFFLVFLGLVGVRAAWRVHNELQDRKKYESDGHRHRVLLIGAGEAGVMVSREIVSRPDLGLAPVGFIDDNPHKVRTSIGGLRVLGTTADIKTIAERVQARRALITISHASGQEIRRIMELCRDAGLDTKIIPGIHEIVGDQVNLSTVREVAIEDFCGRERRFGLTPDQIEPLPARVAAGDDKGSSAASSRG